MMKSDDKPKLPGWLAKKYGGKSVQTPHATSSNHDHKSDSKSANGKKLTLVQLPKPNDSAKN